MMVGASEGSSPCFSLFSKVGKYSHEWGVMLSDIRGGVWRPAGEPSMKSHLERVLDRHEAHVWGGG